MAVSEKALAVARQQFARSGGKARAKKMTPEERRASAIKAAAARWNSQRIKRNVIWWKDDLCLLDMTIVGGIEETPRLGDWFAFACDVDWQDVDLGRRPTRGAAKAAVEYWVKARM